MLWGRWLKSNVSLKTSREDNTPIQALAALHESASLRAVTGTFLRPAGFFLTERGLSLCGFNPGARIVDAGCGTGASVSRLRGKFRFRAMGFDLSGDLIRNNGCANPLPFARARAEELPLPDDCCDGVLCECVLSLLAEPERAATEFSRILHRGGFLILSDMYDRCRIDDSYPASTGEGGCASILRSRTSIEKILGDAGFCLVAWEDHTRYLKELVAQMILSGEPCAELSSLRQFFGAGSAAPSGLPRSRPGYFLLVAQKLTKGDVRNG